MSIDNQWPTLATVSNRTDAGEQIEDVIASMSQSEVDRARAEGQQIVDILKPLIEQFKDWGII